MLRRRRQAAGHDAACRCRPKLLISGRTCRFRLAVDALSSVSAFELHGPTLNNEHVLVGEHVNFNFDEFYAGR